VLFHATTAWGIPESAFGVYIGSTLHEVAQVIGAARSISDHATDTAVISKMVRILALAPLLLCLAWRQRERDGEAGNGETVGMAGALRAVPWFAFGFVAVIALHSLGAVPAAWQPSLVDLDTWLLASAMFAIGTQTRVSTLIAAGARPMAMAGALFVYLIVGGALITALCQYGRHALNF
jgi:uncharacterized integral membrane protein (TIGR00698 family)